MNNIAFQRALNELETVLPQLVSMLPPAQKVRCKDGFVYRYVEKTIEQAIVQKLARIVSGLHSALILHECGFVQEQAALHRMIDEYQEDVVFLSHAVITQDITDRHIQFLSDFNQEEFDLITGAPSEQDRRMVARKKIRAYIARIQESGGNPSRNTEVMKVLSKTYSGYVHAAAPQIMDMYGGETPHFHVSGLTGTPVMKKYGLDLQNYYYRAIMAFGLACKAFGSQALSEKVDVACINFKKFMGKAYTSRIQT